MSKILRESHLNIFKNLPEFIKEEFVFSGGTALAEYYLEHRLSDDIDFFSIKKNTPIPIDSLLGALSAIGETQYEHTHGRGIFGTLSLDEMIKIDFCPLYFDRINPPIKQKHGYLVDSLDDIAANKLLALCGRHEPKDFIDIYFLNKFLNLDIEALVGLAEKKSQQSYRYLLNLDRAERVCFDKDVFKIVVDFHPDDLKDYFYQQNKRLKEQALSNADSDEESDFRM